MFFSRLSLGDRKFFNIRLFDFGFNFIKKKTSLNLLESDQLNNTNNYDNECLVFAANDDYLSTQVLLAISALHSSVDLILLLFLIKTNKLFGQARGTIKYPEK